MNILNKYIYKKFSFLILLAAVCYACNTTPSLKNNANPAINGSHANTILDQGDNPNFPVAITYEIVNVFKHDRKAFTEGLFFHHGALYESTGLEGKSELRKVDLETGKILQKTDLPEESFGEGTTLFNDKIYQLTYKEGICRVFDAESFQQLKEFKYAGQGWGLAHDDKYLIMSDGTHVIRYLNPENFQVEKTIIVFDEKGKPLMNINELELIKGELWANIWHSENIGKPNHIARIDPQTGRLLGWINLDGISPDDTGKDIENTLNGIAYDPATERIFVTGKNWKRLFEIKIKPQS